MSRPAQSQDEVDRYKAGSLRNLNDPLRDVEDPCSRTEDILRECRNFHSNYVMNHIFYHDYIRKDFVFEIETLMKLLIRETYEKLTPKEHQELAELKTKYYVKNTYAQAWVTSVFSMSMQPPTLERLRSMFPHMAMAEKMKSIEPKIESVNSTPELHTALYLPEFGGLIPTEKILKKESREALIILHLSAMERLEDPPMPLYTRHAVLKKHLESSMLSDERRMTQLILLDLIYGGGDLTPGTQAALTELNEREPIFQKHVNFKALT